MSVFLGCRQILRDQFGIIQRQLVILDLAAQGSPGHLRNPSRCARSTASSFPGLPQIPVGDTDLQSAQPARCSADVARAERRIRQRENAFVFIIDYSFPLGISASGTSRA